jgi:hypothetical protein
MQIFNEPTTAAMVYQLDKKDVKRNYIDFRS